MKTSRFQYKNAVLTFILKQIGNYTENVLMIIWSRRNKQVTATCRTNLPNHTIRNVMVHIVVTSDRSDLSRLGDFNCHMLLWWTHWPLLISSGRQTTRPEGSSKAKLIAGVSFQYQRCSVRYNIECSRRLRSSLFALAPIIYWSFPTGTPSAAVWSIFSRQPVRTIWRSRRRLPKLQRPMSRKVLGGAKHAFTWSIMKCDSAAFPSLRCHSMFSNYY